MRRLPALVVAAVATAALSSCDGDDTAKTVSSTESTVATTTSIPSTVPAAASTATTVEPTNPTAFLKTIEVDRNGDKPRIVFTFVNEVPGYQVEYVKRPVLSDGEGAEVSVTGEAVLQVTLANASGVDLSTPVSDTELYTTHYKGPTRFTPTDTSFVKEMVRTGDFEARLGWAVGTTSERPFVVTTNAAEKKVVITFE
jgi:hypothetical protein